MKLGAAVDRNIGSFLVAWKYQWPFLLAHLLTRLLVLAVITPLSGLIVSIAIATRGQVALTDQDIAYFFLSPLGLVVGLIILCLFIVGAVVDVSIMTCMLRTSIPQPIKTLTVGMRFIILHIGSILLFCLHLTCRIILISIPFIICIYVIYWFSFSHYDINYYLTNWPPDFMFAAVVIFLIAFVMAIFLVERLTGWGIAIHLLLFEGYPTRKAFTRSRQLLVGSKAQFAATIAIWVLIRISLGSGIAIIVGALLNLLPGMFDSNLTRVAAATIVLLCLWAVANAFASGISNGALSDILYRWYLRQSTSPSQDIVPNLEDSNTDASMIPLSVFAIITIVVIVGGAIASQKLLENVTSSHSVEIIAHRGAAISRPENTIAAIAKAVEDKADWVEIDVQETADSKVIVAHDSDFMKQANVDTKVWDVTTSKLAEIDIGSWFDPSYSNERTPLLRKALQTVKGHASVIIELKYYGHDIELEKRVVEIVEEVDMVKDVAVMSLKYEGIRKIQKLRPGWRYGALAATAIVDLAAIDVDFLAVNSGQISVQLIQRAHAQNKQVYAWTVNDPLTMSRMISMGVDGLITDDPGLARQIMIARNELSTYQRLALWLTDRLQIRGFKLSAMESDA